MSKRKTKKEPEAQKQFAIISASIKDGLCNYSFEILTGIGQGNTHNVKGKGIVDDDMHTAFQKFNAHLAVVDDVFKHSGIDISNIDKMHNNELTALFSVSGFKIKGDPENESISLIGSKNVSSGGTIELESPKIPLDALSSYEWYNELKEAADDARKEVQLYHQGKYTAIEPEDIEDPKQLKITDDMDNVEFENAKV